MHVDQQQMLAAAQADQRRPNQWTGPQVERPLGVFIGQALRERVDGDITAFLAAFDAGLHSLGVSLSAIFVANTIVALLMGFEASSLRRWTLSRGKWRQLDVVVADDEDTAERRFFERWSQKQRGIVNDQWAVDRGGPPPTRGVPGQPFSSPPPMPAGAAARRAEEERGRLALAGSLRPSPPASGSSAPRTERVAEARS